MAIRERSDNEPGLLALLTVVVLILVSCSGSKPIVLENHPELRAGAVAHLEAIDFVTQALGEPDSTRPREVIACGFGLIGGPHPDEATYHGREVASWEAGADASKPMVSDLLDVWISSGLHVKDDFGDYVTVEGQEGGSRYALTAYVSTDHEALVLSATSNCYTLDELNLE